MPEPHLPPAGAPVSGRSVAIEGPAAGRLHQRALRKPDGRELILFHDRAPRTPGSAAARSIIRVDLAGRDLEVFGERAAGFEEDPARVLDPPFAEGGDGLEHPCSPLAAKRRARPAPSRRAMTR